VIKTLLIQFRLLIPTFLIIIIIPKATTYAKTNNSIKTEKLSEIKTSKCENYKSLTAVDRQIISDTRYALESIEMKLTETEFNSKLVSVLNKYGLYFKSEPLSNHLQGLIAELYLRKLIYKTIGITNSAYRKFTIFMDLILYHGAMNNLGYVNENDFNLAKKNLISAITNYFNEQQKSILKVFMQGHTQILSAITKKIPLNNSLTEQATQFMSLDNLKSQMLGTIDLIWAQLLNRNQQNRMESLATDAVIDISVNTAAALSGIASLMRLALTSSVASGAVARLLGTASNSAWALTLEAAIGCGVGMTAKFTVGTLDTSYLDMSKALYSSFVNKTSFACELGEVMSKDNTSPAKNIIIPDSHPSHSNTDYLVACASGTMIRVLPNSLGLVVDGMVFTSLASISFNLANETYTVLSEVPRLYQLKAKAKELNNNSIEVELINKKIEESEAKIVLYLLAMGDSSILALRNGFFLYIHKTEISRATQSARTLLELQQSTATNKLADTNGTGLSTLRFIVDKLK